MYIKYARKRWRESSIVTSYQLPIGFPTFKAVGKSMRGFLFCITMPDWLSPKSNAMLPSNTT